MGKLTKTINGCLQFMNYFETTLDSRPNIQRNIEVYITFSAAYILQMVMKLKRFWEWLS